MKNRVNRTILTPALNRGPATTPNPQPVQQAYYNARLLHTSPHPKEQLRMYGAPLLDMHICNLYTPKPMTFATGAYLLAETR